MTRYYRRTSPGAKENAGAAVVALGLAAGVAAVTFYFVRLFLAREPLGPFPPPRLPPGGDPALGLAPDPELVSGEPSSLPEDQG